jgi:hypothetical protein
LICSAVTCVPQELGDAVVDHPLEQPHQEVNLQLQIPRTVRHRPEGIGKRAPGQTRWSGVTLGRLQFSWEKAKAVSARMPQAREIRTVSSSARRPASCPNAGGIPRARAHREFPSITTATCRGSDSARSPGGRSDPAAGAPPARGHDGAERRSEVEIGSCGWVAAGDWESSMGLGALAV